MSLQAVKSAQERRPQRACLSLRNEEMENLRCQCEKKRNEAQYHDNGCFP